MIDDGFVFRNDFVIKCINFYTKTPKTSARIPEAAKMADDDLIFHLGIGGVAENSEATGPAFFDPSVPFFVKSLMENLTRNFE